MHVESEDNAQANPKCSYKDVIEAYHQYRNVKVEQEQDLRRKTNKFTESTPAGH